MTLHWPPVERCGVDPDVVHVLNPSFPVPSRSPAVYALHDVMPLTHPEWYRRKEVAGHARALGHARRHASAFVADSAFTADDAADIGGIDRDRIHVVPLGVGDQFRREIGDDEVARACQRAGVEPGRYVIAVGSVNARKNLSVLVRALATAGSSLDGTILLFAGPHRTGAEQLLRLAADLKLSHRVRVPGFVADDDVPALLRGAIALAHPSLDEGFGLPPLEAMAVGTPAIVSRAGALPEVVGGAALLVDPHDDAGWAKALVHLASDDDERTRLVDRGLAHSSAFRWQRTARETIAVWDGVIAQRA
jgi:alpha-1,3-rhamnosyl/mannosyltransferase